MGSHEMYEKVKMIVTGGGGLSPALDAYAKAYFREPPVMGEWTEQNMREELYMLLWKHTDGCIDIRYRSAKSILRERLEAARRQIQYSEDYRKLADEEKSRMASFIKRYHLGTLYENHLEDIRKGTVHMYPYEEEIPFL